MKKKKEKIKEIVIYVSKGSVNAARLALGEVESGREVR
jgi:hypothetical protein